MDSFRDSLRFLDTWDFSLTGKRTLCGGKSELHVGRPLRPTHDAARPPCRTRGERPRRAGRLRPCARHARTLNRRPPFQALRRQGKESMKHRATGRPRGRPPSLPFDLAEQILRDLESRMDRNTMLVSPGIASMAKKLNVSRSSIKREIVSIRNNGFLELCHIYKRPMDKVCTIMYRILRPSLPSTDTHCGS